MSILSYLDTLQSLITQSLVPLSCQTELLSTDAEGWLHVRDVNKLIKVEDIDHWALEDRQLVGIFDWQSLQAKDHLELALITKLLDSAW